MTTGVCRERGKMRNGERKRKIGWLHWRSLLLALERVVNNEGKQVDVVLVPFKVKGSSKWHPKCAVIQESRGGFITPWNYNEQVFNILNTFIFEGRFPTKKTFVVWLAE